MKGRLFFASAMLCMLFLASFALIPSSATSVDYSRVGVKTGDWADYSITTTNRTYFDLGSINRTTETFTNVTGVMSTLNLSYYNLDGSKDLSVIITGNVSDSLGTLHYNSTFSYPTLLFTYLIPANLSSGDPLFDGSPIHINETTTMLTGGVNRTVDHLNSTTRLGTGQSYANETANVYWDKLSGLIVEDTIYITGAGWDNETLTSTSLWRSGGGSGGNLIFGLSISEFLLIVAVASVIVIVVGWAVLRRGKKTLKAWTPPEISDEGPTALESPSYDSNSFGSNLTLRY